MLMNGDQNKESVAEFIKENLMKTALNLNGSDLVGAFELLGFHEIVEEDNFTLFMPVNEAFGKEDALPELGVCL
jgi:uncharacterized surface protein with fasciclin (FAS1) repeats